MLLGMLWRTPAYVAEKVRFLIHSCRENTDIFLWILGRCVDIFVNNLNLMRFGDSSVNGVVHPQSKAA